MAKQTDAIQRTTHPNRAAFPPGLSGPALRALHNARIRNLAELAGWTEASVGALHGMGPKGVYTLREALAAKGQRFLPP